MLAARGHVVRTVDLPGRTPHGQAGWGQTLGAYAHAIVGAVRAMDGPVVVVGHSMGGQVISAAAEAAPDHFARLIFLSAFLPCDGDSIATFARQNHGSALPGATQISMLKGSFRILTHAAQPAFYHDCPDADVAATLPRLSPEALRPSLTRIRLTEARFGRVPRSYIRLTEDRVLVPGLQDWMLARQPCDRVVSLPSSHSPFFSMPDALTDAIEDAAF